MTHAAIFFLAALLLTFLGGRASTSEAKPEWSYKHTNMLRGVAILMIMGGHLSGVFLDTWQRFLTPAGGVGVAIFLIISGYGINESYKEKGLSLFWLKKFFRVFFPYVLLELFFLLINAYHLSGWKLALDLLCLRTRLWFVSYILYMYVAFYFFTRWIPNQRLTMLCLTSLAMLFLMDGVEGEQAFSFLTGTAISAHKDKAVAWLTRYRYKLSAILVAIGTLFLCLKQLPAVRAYGEGCIMNIVQMFIKLPWGLAIVLITQRAIRLQNSRFLSFCGNISYELYLVHFTMFFSAFWIIAPLNWYGCFLVCIASFFGAWLLAMINTRVSSSILSRL